VPLPDLRPRIEQIARAILGEPNERLSTRTQLRFGRNGSVAVEIAGQKRGEWYDHEGAVGGGPWELLTIKGRMANGTAVEWLQSELGIEINPAARTTRRIVATYDYRDEQGVVLFQVCRFEPKDFRQRRPDGNGGWIWQVKGTAQVPYRLPELIAASSDSMVFIVEGEKDADRLADLGLVATCNAGGAAKRRADGKPSKPKWRPELNPFFQGRNVVILRDNDDAGRDHARSIAANLTPVAGSVRILELPDLPPKGDVSDWLDAGSSLEELQRLAAVAPVIPQDGDTEAAPIGDEGEEPAEISRLAKLPRLDYERERETAAERLGCRVSILDDLVRAKRRKQRGNGTGLLGQGPLPASPSSHPKSKQADILIELSEEAELFHTPDGTAYADLMIGGHRETWAIKTRVFRQWLARRFYRVTGGAPNSEALQSALNIIEAIARFDGPECTVHVRVGGLDDKLYLDLADGQWRAVEIDSSAWRIVADPPVRFRRCVGMRPLPVPQRGGRIDDLRPFLNVSSEADFVLAVAWVLAALRDRGPYPVLALSGEQGSAKTFRAAVLRSLVDPNTAPLRSLPRDDRDLFIAATNGHVVAFDNVSSLLAWLSDTLCRLSTGGGFATRQLYTDQDEVLFDATRPIILTAIEDVVIRGDLADRSIFLELRPIPEDRRRSEKELWTTFEVVRPGILGALLDAVAYGLRMLPSTSLSRLPRMADFALWATACEGALWPAGTFERAYTGNRDEAAADVIDADLVATAIRTFIATSGEWTGTATELLAVLAGKVGEKAKAKTWPASPRALSGRLRRAAANLRRIGINVTFDRGHGRKRSRIITVNTAESGGSQPSATSEQSETEAESPVINDPGTSGPRTQSCDGDLSTVRPDGTRSATDEMQVQPADANADRADGMDFPTARGKPLKNRGGDGADGSDANMPKVSESW